MGIRWPRALTAAFAPRGDTLLLLLALLSIVSLLTHELSRRSVLAAEFEGFDSDEFEESEDLTGADNLPPSGSPPLQSSLLSQSASPESHHGPPSAPKPPTASDLWDEDEFEGIPVDVQSPDPTDATVDEPVAASAPSTPPPPFSIKSYATEIACVSFLICFIINYFTGRRENEAIALAWAGKFATKDSIFDKNFSLLGTGDGKDTPLLLKEGQDVFKFYASGRRYCQSMLATMEMRSRHDLISRALDLVLPKRDLITFEVVMNDDVMDNIVLAIARKKLAKSMHKEEWDLQRFANLVVAPPSGKKWVAEELLVIAESKEVAGDLITDVVLDQVFGDKAFEKVGKWFVSLHFSDRPGTQKKTLVFKFSLPDVRNMADMSRLVALVPYYIDVIGRYKLSNHASSKTAAARAKVAQEQYKELQTLRQEAIQKKKVEKKKLMEEADSKLTAEALRRKEEKDRARQLKKSMPKAKMLRSH